MSSKKKNSKPTTTKTNDKQVGDIFWGLLKILEGNDIKRVAGKKDVFEVVGKTTKQPDYVGFTEAFKALEEGKRIRRGAYPDDMYLTKPEKQEDAVLCMCNGSAVGETDSFTIKAIRAKDWIILN